MAGSAPVVEKPKLGRSATITGFIFALLVLTAFSGATAASYRDTVSEKYGHSDEYSDDYGDEYSDDEHAEDDHADE